MSKRNQALKWPRRAKAAESSAPSLTREVEEWNQEQEKFRVELQQSRKSPREKVNETVSPVDFRRLIL